MALYRIRHAERLRGELEIHTAKNAVLPILCAGLLTREPLRIEGVPHLTDVDTLWAILQDCGAQICREGDALTLFTPEPVSPVEEDLLSRMRASVLVMGPLLARTGYARVGLPGGCAIGQRPIDLHLKGMQALGAESTLTPGSVTLQGTLRGGSVYLDFPSVGATENVMMAAVLLPGTTVIHNPAREPEIADLQAFINAMGGKIRGAGTHYIAVEGVERLHGTAWTPMADRIVAGTLLAAAAITGGEITLTNAPESDMVAVTAKLREMGCRLEERPGWIHLRAPKRLTAFAQLQTQPHPGFPTDMQVQMLALLSTAEGMGVITENVFENRFTHAGDLNRMGAHILCTGRTAVVRGVPELYGAHVTARDLRGGAALVLAGLRARGETLVDHAELIDRGYDHLERQLSRLGGKVRRVSAVPGEV